MTLQYRKEEELIEVIARLKDTELDTFTNREQLLILSNIILLIAEEYFPANLKNDAKRILVDGRSVAYEKVNNPDNIGINLAHYAHHLTRIAGNC